MTKREISARFNSIQPDFPTQQGLVADSTLLSQNYKGYYPVACETRLPVEDVFMIRKARKGTALIREGIGGARVSFGTVISLPIVHWTTEIDLSIRRFELSFLETSGLSCKDRIKADLTFVFFVAPKTNEQDILKLHGTFGSGVPETPEELKKLFDAKFTEAIKICVHRFEFAELLEARDKFREMILETIGDDLLGFMIEDCVIDHLKQTALEFHDPNNILDSEGIKKITEQTAAAEMESRKLQREKEKREAIERAKSK